MEELGAPAKFDPKAVRDAYDEGERVLAEERELEGNISSGISNQYAVLAREEEEYEELVKEFGDTAYDGTAIT